MHGWSSIIRNKICVEA